MKPVHFYSFLIILCMAGFGWIALHWSEPATLKGDTSWCPLKQLTGLPCPACGTTRSAVSFLHGDIGSTWMINPLGFAAVFFLFMAPLWIGTDVVRKKYTFLSAYRYSEKLLSRKTIAIPAVMLLMANWAWNIVKGI